MRKGIICIYKITSPTKRVYIGQTVCFKSRMNHYKNLHCKGQHILRNSLLKYGFNKHKIEILTECSIPELNAFERFFQEAYNSIHHKRGMNIRLVGYEERSGSLPEYIKEKISIANSGKGNGMYGRKITESAKQMQRDKLSGDKNYLSKLILNTETGIYYPCLREAAESVCMIKASLWAAIVKYKVNNTSFIYA